MTDKVALTAEPRYDVGKGASRRLRRQNHIPGIIYGGTGEPRMISVPYRDLKIAMQSDAFFSQVLSIRIGRETEETIVKDLQRNPARDDVAHMDFVRVVAGQLYNVHVPLHFIGEEGCRGVKEGGGNLLHQMNEIEITALPKDLPEFLEVGVSDLNVGDTRHLSEVPLPHGVTIPSLELGVDHDQPVATVVAPRAAREMTEAATEAGEPSEVPEGEVEADTPTDEAASGSDAEDASPAS